jgi:hypothetical protein
MPKVAASAVECQSVTAKPDLDTVAVRSTNLASWENYNSATHDPTHNRSGLHVLGRTYAAVRDLQVVECIGLPQTEKAGVGRSIPSLATTFSMT